MNFMSALILSVVYFITSVWSTGLDEGIIRTCISLYKKPLYIKEIPNLLETECGIEYPENDFQYDPAELEYINVMKLMLVFAYKGIFISFEYPMLTALEVDFYLKMFKRYVENLSQPGYLNRFQLSVVFDHLNLNEKEKDTAENVTNQIIGGDKINILQFLLIMFKILPEGNGLNQKQIEEFIKLYEDHKTETHSSEPFDPFKIQNIFKKFKMADESYEDLMLFESNRPAAKELMELLIVTAERSKTVHEDGEIVLSTKDVRSLISQFVKLDMDTDGLLANEEAIEFLGCFYPHIPAVNFVGKDINVAEFLLFNYFKQRNMDLIECFVTDTI